MVAPSGEQFEITGGGYRAVVTECGAGLRVLEHLGRPVVHGYAEGEMCRSGRGQLLVPWPNRVADGRYTFAGTEHQLPLSEPARGNAGHGLVRWASWTVEEQAEASVSLVYRLMAQTGYPWTLDLHVIYDLSADGLTVTLTATNLSDHPAPYAQGFHPYLTVGDGPVDGWELTLPAGIRVEVDDRKLPSGRGDVGGTPYDFRVARPVKDAVFDNPFTDLDRGDDGRATVLVSNPEDGRSVGLWMDPAHRWVQVYSGDDLGPAARTSLAVEPMTAPPDALRTGEDLVVLGPAGSADDEHSSSWGIHVG